jgi:hypothetical protein
VQRPDWLFLDEATSAVDEATEAHLYRLVHDRLPGTTLFSVGHRSTLRPFHDRQLFAQPDGDGPASIVDVSASSHQDLEAGWTNGNTATCSPAAWINCESGSPIKGMPSGGGQYTATR